MVDQQRAAVIRDAAATLRASAGELEAVRRRGGSNGSDGGDLAGLAAEAGRRRRLADELEGIAPWTPEVTRV